MTLMAGVAVFVGQLWYIDIEPGFVADGIAFAYPLGFVAFVTITVLFVLDLLQRSKHERRTTTFAGDIAARPPRIGTPAD